MTVTPEMINAGRSKSDGSMREIYLAMKALDPEYERLREELARWKSECRLLVDTMEADALAGMLRGMATAIREGRADHMGDGCAASCEQAADALSQTQFQPQEQSSASD